MCGRDLKLLVIILIKILDAHFRGLTIKHSHITTSTCMLLKTELTSAISQIYLETVLLMSLYFCHRVVIMMRCVVYCYLSLIIFYRVIVDHFSPFLDKASSVVWHIDHKYSEEMKQKSKIVSMTLMTSHFRFLLELF